MQIGHLDGVVADDGKVTLRYKWTVDKLPPEVLEAVKYGRDEPVVAGGLYRCNESSQCKRSSRPGRSSQWKRVGRCK
jgi:hypothetical protein